MRSHSQLASPFTLIRTRVGPQQRRGRITRTPVWRGRSPAQSLGPCCRRPRLGWPRPLLPWRMRTEDWETVCPTPQVHLKLACPACPRQLPLVTPHTRAPLPSDCLLQKWWVPAERKKKQTDLKHSSRFCLLLIFYLNEFLSCCRMILSDIHWCHYKVRFPLWEGDFPPHYSSHHFTFYAPWFGLKGSCTQTV